MEFVKKYIKVTYIQKQLWQEWISVHFEAIRDPMFIKVSYTLYISLIVYWVSLTFSIKQQINRSN